ncbi:PF07588 family protein [Leptospira fainei serovar Hurstbridge str. BUT 6]|uniref:PF07588 family protein n=1 Tax=Leptospira fainei serovar Hurstbridge str. BUT 6 TaxID=1193011 RepID=S3V129_9LEPT|nr:DUF1554 domain-containing protein [Leptospira fainei]EPG74329.1 PF07588 family protein [Leptospira fainei serovar Hurstbridge str. BUT 6]
MKLYDFKTLGLLILYAILSVHCNQAKPMQLDSSKSPLGAFLPNIIFALSVTPIQFQSSATVTENSSLVISIASTEKLDSPVTYNLSFSSPIMTISPSSITLSSSSPSATVTVTHGIDNDCLDQNYPLVAIQTDKGLSQTLQVGTADIDKCTFVATNQAQGGIGYFGTFGGVPGADAICASEKPASLPGATTSYKALITVQTGTVVRAITSTANCGLPSTPNCNNNHNWVLATNTRYYGSDALTLLFKTHAQAPIFYFTSGNLTSPLGMGASGGIWTGLKSDWTETASYQCMAIVPTYEEWFPNPYSYYINTAHYGSLSAVDSTSLDTGTAATDCTTVRKNLFCIRQ